jgi:hypothetical protein
MRTSDVQDGVKEVELQSWREFFDLTVKEFATGPAYIYHGQANYDWPLRSTLDRHEARYPQRKNLTCENPEFFNAPPFTEEQHLHAFRRAVCGRRGPGPQKLSNDQYWVLGQHHGLATPLLDWTGAPFVALFFAFEQERCFLAPGEWNEPEYRGVYALSTCKIEGLDTREPSAPRLVSDENDANYRLVSQASFLIGLPRRVDLEACIKRCFPGESPQAIFTKVKIPNRDRDACLVALNKMNINHMTLFPDIDGAAKHVNSLWQPGHEDSIAYV